MQWCAAGWNSLQCRGDSRVTAEDVNTLLVFTLCLTTWTFDTCHVEQQRIKSRKGAALRSTATPASASLAALKHASCWIVNNAAVKLLISLDITTNVYKLSVGQLRPLSPAGQLSGWVFINYSTFRQHITLVLLLFFSLLFFNPPFPLPILALCIGDCTNVFHHYFMAPSAHICIIQSVIEAQGQFGFCRQDVLLFVFFLKEIHFKEPLCILLSFSP